MGPERPDRRRRGSERTPDRLLAVRDGGRESLPVLRFGDVTFDPVRRVVLQGRRTLHLGPHGFRLLELLLTSRPKALSKAEILEAVWPDAVVAEGSLSTLVKDVRKALGENARSPSYIRTVFGFGYAFEGTVHEVAPTVPSPLRHVLVCGGEGVRLAEGANLIGRESTAALVIRHPSVSREHARIDVEGDCAFLEDLGSKNGTWLGSAKVEARTTLTDGDELRIGAVHLTYRGPSASPRDGTATYP